MKDKMVLDQAFLLKVYSCKKEQQCHSSYSQILFLTARPVCFITRMHAIKVITCMADKSAVQPSFH